jgi:hypothetical protein
LKGVNAPSFRIYCRAVIRRLGEIGVGRGLDKNFAQVRCQGMVGYGAGRSAVKSV